MELIRYVWNPDSPTIDQTEKKHTTTSRTVPSRVKDKLWTQFRRKHPPVVSRDTRRGRNSEFCPLTLKVHQSHHEETRFYKHVFRF